MSSRPVKIAIAAVAASAVAVSAFGVSAAFADPSSTTARTYTAVGSDTIQAVYDSFGNGYASNAAIASIASYFATDPQADPTKPADPPTSVTKVTPTNSLVPTNSNTIGRPNGSGDGRAAVSAAWNTASNVFVQGGVNYAVTPHSIDIGRASGLPGSPAAATTDPTGAQLEYVPLGRDAVSVVTNGLSIANFSTNELQAIFGGPDTAGITGLSHASEGQYIQSGVYQANRATDPSTWSNLTTGDIVRNTGAGTNEPQYVTVNGDSSISLTPLHPLLPQGSSGTRQFFLKAVGVTDANYQSKDSANPSWIPAAANIEENTMSQVAAVANAVAPFSAAAWISQKNGVAPSTAGSVNVAGLAITSIDSHSPIATSGTKLVPNAALYGDVNTVPTSSTPGGALRGVFNRDVYSVVALDALTFDAGLENLVKVTLPNSNNVVDFGFEKVGYTTAGYRYSPFQNLNTTTSNSTTSTSLSVAGSADLASTTLTAKVAPVTSTMGSAAIAAGTVNGIPTGGTVTFTDNGAVVATVTVGANGVATAPVPASAGDHTFGATYSGVSTGPWTATTSSAAAVTQHVAGVGTTTPAVTASSVKISDTTPTVGQKLTASVAGLSAGATALYQWTYGTSHSTLSTSSSFTVPAAASGKTLSVSVVVFKTGSTSSQVNATPTSKVAAGKQSTKAKVTISGTAKVGKTLSAKTSGFVSGTKYTYSWKAAGKAIRGASHATYKVASSLKGKKITVTVTAKLAGYTTVSKTSSSTRAVAK